MRLPFLPLLVALSLGTASASPEKASFLTWAERPPMGWNSWDCFATTVTEALTQKHADIMAEKLKVHGWEYVVVDIQWYEPSATGFDYHADAKLIMDDFGRLLPATTKFPGSAEGRGFKPLADYVHAKGLKFGIHLMRGIPRQAVEKNLPVKGTSVRATDIADKVNVCEWNKDMYGVDMTKPGAQAYYDSVFELIASWGVDYVKVDDLSRPYVRNEPEIEAIRKAIDRTGRPIVLSLSPGETDIRAADHVVSHANLWRISDDFWDRWSLLEAQFARLDAWTPWRRPGAWPDADMIPFGTIELGRKTYFTPEEQRTLMTLWCIARSPLMLGADLTKLDEATFALVTNDAVLAVNQASTNNRQVSRDAQGRIVWVADVPNSSDKYVALFNTRDPWVLEDAKRVWGSEPITEKSAGQKISFDVSTKDIHTLVLRADPGDSDRFWWGAVWRDLAWVMADGSVQKIDRDYGSHGEKVNGLVVPQGALRLRGTGVLDHAALERKRGEHLQFSVYAYHASDLASNGQQVTVKLSELGLAESATVQDLWSGKSAGTAKHTLSAHVEWHGAQLFRLSPAK
jgi:hypothetical protein